MSSWRRHRFLAFFLSALIVLAQQGAVAHWASHVVKGSPDQQKTLLHHKLCGKCLSAEKFTNAISSGPATLASPDCSYFLALAENHTCAQEIRVSYQSRAPPQIL